MAKAFPDGFRGDGPEGDWYINSIWQHVELDYPDLMAGAPTGSRCPQGGRRGVTGLEINQFVLLNIDGLQQLINAMGGVTVNINEELAIGGDTAKGTKPKRFLQPGPNQHLNGYDAMWYARSRYNTNDYNRMERQSCLVNAIVDQANPQTLLTNFEPIVKASADMLATDITDDQLSAYIDLAFRVKDKGTISRLVFSNGNNGYSYAHPDFAKMRKVVAKAINPAPPKSTAKPTAKATPSTAPTTQSSPKPTLPRRRRPPRKGSVTSPTPAPGRARADARASRHPIDLAAGGLMTNDAHRPQSDDDAEPTLVRRDEVDLTAVDARREAWEPMATDAVPADFGPRPAARGSGPHSS
ncbi:LCP family protein [Tessaracoccus sp. HDW20]|uniref:LCP family protein n=1 Tax=Tessaracoccus coleopterorum TaxID=2714950 RepID=UPI0018D2D1A7|nr:LCP family protein [Tessaracoccus coleopterorum]NHB85181.1 LCP family protein [Tessaracoccus coleopterorum]